MAYIRVVIFCCLALATMKAASLVDGIPHPHLNLSSLGLPEIPHVGQPLNPSSLPFLDGLGRSKRQGESITDVTNVEETQGDSSISENPTCDLPEGNSTCINCRQMLFCFDDKFGFIKSCVGLRGYCSEGECTYERPTDCDN